MTALRKFDELLSPDQYLEQERAADFRSEYFNGRIVAMAGGTIEHSLISTKILRLLGNQLDGRPCHVFNSDMKVRVDRANLFRYPDISALCGPILLHDRSRDAYCNPTLIIEILSSSTAPSDRGAKFALYRLLDSLIEYVLVEQESHRAELFRKQADGKWTTRIFTSDDDIIPLDSIGAELRLADIYALGTLPG